MNKLEIYVLVALMLGLTFSLAEEPVDPAVPRQCYFCTGINCQRTSRTSNTTVQCTDVLDICVTIFDGQTVIAQGCYLQMAEEERSKCDNDEDSECVKCFGQLCNNKGRSDFKCIQCKDKSKCASDTSAMIGEVCALPTAPNSYCYVRSSASGVVERGCLTNVKTQVDCLAANNCSMCLSESAEACNSYNLPAISGALILKSSSVLLFILSIIILQNFAMSLI